MNANTKRSFPSGLPEGVTPQAFHVALLSMLTELGMECQAYPNRVASTAILATFVMSLYGHAHEHDTEPCVPRADIDAASLYVLTQFERFKDMTEARP